MASLDFEPENRLEAAKGVIAEFVEQRPYDKIGLVIFSFEAFNQSPLTLDHQMLDRSLNQVQLAADLGIEDGTAIGMGLANAANMLANSENDSRVIILLTDGVNNAGQIDPLTAAEAAKALGIKVYTVGAAKLGMVPVPVQGLLGGTQIIQQESMLDEATLQQVADITGGLYFRAEDTEGLKEIYDEINSLEKSQVEVQVFNQYRELAGWLIVPAAAFFLAELFLRKSIFRKIP
jgi:Ca-activated chloride channel family protein